MIWLILAVALAAFVGGVLVWRKNGANVEAKVDQIKKDL